MVLLQKFLIIKDASNSSDRPYSVINYTNETNNPTIESITGNQISWTKDGVNLTVELSDTGGSNISAYSFSSAQYQNNWQTSNVSPTYITN